MNEEMRKEFEVWWSSYCDDLGFNYSFATLLNGEYANWPEHNAWIGWQASREAMKPIELPKKYLTVIDNECYYYNAAIEECESAIEQAGYKVAL